MGSISLDDIPFVGRPERPAGAVEWTDGSARVPSEQLRLLVDALVREMESRRLRPGDRVALFLEPSLEAIAGVAATLRLGAACVPLDPKSPAAQLGSVASSVRPSIILSTSKLLADSSWLSRFAERSERVLAVDRLEPVGALPNGAVAHDPALPAVIAFAPLRGVIFDRGSLGARLRGLQSWLQLSASDRCLFHAPIHRDAIGPQLLLPLLAGSTLVLPAPGRRELLEDLCTSAATVAWLTPDELARLAACPMEAEDRVRLRTVVCSGVPATSDAARFAERFSARLLTSFGWPEAPELAVKDLAPGAAGAPPLGKPLHGPLVVLDGADRPVPSGMLGALHAAGEAIGSGYWSGAEDAEPGARGFVMVEGVRLFRTGQTVRAEADGQGYATTDPRVAWVDGFAVRCDEIEQRLGRLPHVLRCRVVPRVCRDGAERPVAYVVLEDSGTLRTLRSTLEATLPGCCVPAHLVEVAAIPLNDAGKPDDDALAEVPVLDAEWRESVSAALAGLPGVRDHAVGERAQAPRARSWTRARLLASGVKTTDRAVEARHSGPPALIERPPVEAAPKNLGQALRASARTFPDRGITAHQEDGSQIALSWPALLERAERAHAGLLAIGARPGDEILLHGSSRLDTLVLFWGCAVGGFPCLILSETNAAAPPEVESRLRRPHRVGAEEGARILSNEARQPPREIDPSETALLCLTSGSKGRPKIAALSHLSLCTRSVAAARFCGLGPEDVVLNWLPYDHIGGIGDWHVRCVVTGCAIHDVPTGMVSGAPLRWIDFLHRTRATQSWAPNFAYALVTAALGTDAEHAWDLRAVRVLLCAGEPISPDVLHEFTRRLARFGLRENTLQPAFGMAEVGSGITYSPPGEPLRTHPAPDGGERQVVDLGEPIAGIGLRVVGKEDTLQAEGVPGRLQVRGDGVFSHYHGDPEATAAAFTRDGWFDTGDRGFLAGGRLVLTGRDKDTVVIRGINYHCEHLGSVVQRVPGVAAASAVVLPVSDHEGGTEGIAAFFSTDEDPARLAALVRRALVRETGIPPLAIVPVDPGALPRTSVGKIQRQELRRLYEEGAFGTGDDASTVPDWFFRRKWRLADLFDPKAEAPDPVLLFQDASGLGASLLAGPLPAAVVVSPGEGYARPTPGRFVIRPGVPEDYTRLLGDLAKENLVPRGVVHLWGVDPAPEGADLEVRLERDCLSVLWMARALSQSGGRASMLVVGAGAQAVLRGEVAVPERAAALGILATARRELPGIRCTHLDLPEGEAAACGELVLRELRRGRDEEVALRSGRRYVPRLSPAELVDEAPRRPPLVAAGAYLVASELDHRALALVEHLRETWSARVAIVCATPPSEIPGSLQGAHDVQVSWADPADQDGLLGAARQAEKRFGRLDGILHLAAPFASRPLRDETAETATPALRAAAQASLSVLHAAAELAIPDVVVLSSLAGHLSRPGLAVEASASRFASALAGRRGQQRVHVLFCAPWLDITPERGITSLLTASCREEGELLIGVDGRDRLVRRQLEGRAVALTEAVAAVALDAEAASPPEIVGTDGCGKEVGVRPTRVDAIPRLSNGGVDWDRLEAPVLQASRPAPIAPRNDLERQIAAIWEKVLGVTGFGVEDDFFELGGHSLLLTQVAVRMQGMFGKNLPSVREFFDVPTVSGMAALVLGAELRAHEPARVKHLLDEIKRLSPGEVQALLEAEGSRAGAR